MLLFILCMFSEVVRKHRKASPGASSGKSCFQEQLPE